MEKYYVVLTADLRIGATSKDFPMSDTPLQVELPEDFNFRRSMDYKLVDGVAHYDPLPEPAPVPSETDLLRQELEQTQLALMQTQLGLVDVFEMMLGGLM